MHFNGSLHDSNIRPFQCSICSKQYCRIFWFWNWCKSSSLYGTIRKPFYLLEQVNHIICFHKKYYSASNILIYSLFGARFRRMCVLMLCGRNSRWNEWLKTGKYVYISSDEFHKSCPKYISQSFFFILNYQIFKNWKTL